MLHLMSTQMAVPPGTRVTGTDISEDQKENFFFFFSSVTICVWGVGGGERTWGWGEEGEMSEIDHPASPFSNLEMKEQGLKHSQLWLLANHLKSIQLVILCI